MNKKGEELAHFLDSMNVCNRWLQNRFVDWLSGADRLEGEHGVDSHYTHCSAFFAAFCHKLNIPMIGPPEHHTEGLANKQSRWLEGAGESFGWIGLTTHMSAQYYANTGYIVCCCWHNPLDPFAGHIAVVRPTRRSYPDVEKNGVQICQAGRVNHSDMLISDGFSTPLECKYYLFNKNIRVLRNNIK